MSACPRCSASDLIEIDLAPQGRPTRFATCRNCEHRWWTDREQVGVVSLEQVLSWVAAA